MNAEIRKPLARIRQDVQSMHAYAVQDSTGMLKLDAMENPHRLSPELQAELGRRLGAVGLRHPVPFRGLPEEGEEALKPFTRSDVHPRPPSAAPGRGLP